MRVTGLRACRHVDALRIASIEQRTVPTPPSPVFASRVAPLSTVAWSVCETILYPDELPIQIDADAVKLCDAICARIGGCTPDTPTLEIDVLYVPKGARGTGWGTRYANALLSWGRRHGARVAVLVAGRLHDIGDHPRGFWGKMGFHPAGVDGIDEVEVMWRPL